MLGLLQHTLDLFALSDFDMEPSGPGDAPRRCLEPVQFRHPRANREIVLGDAAVAYEFMRGKRRTIGFVVGPDGLAVRAPKSATALEVRAALLEKRQWIIRKLVEASERQQRQTSLRVEWKNGTAIPFLGEPMVVRLDPGSSLRSKDAVLDCDAAALPGTPRLNLRLGLPPHCSATEMGDTVQLWLARQARRVFCERLDHFAPRLGVQWRKLTLSSAGTRWGSARSDGSIRLHWRLVHFHTAVIDYVVAHELSHLRVMDHSPRFWDTVRTVLPNYAELRSQLKEESLPRWS